MDSSGNSLTQNSLFHPQTSSTELKGQYAEGAHRGCTVKVVVFFLCKSLFLSSLFAFDESLVGQNIAVHLRLSYAWHQILIRIWMQPSVCTPRSFHPHFCMFMGSLQTWMKWRNTLSTVENLVGSVDDSSSKTRVRHSQRGRGRVRYEEHKGIRFSVHILRCIWWPHNHHL